MEPTSRTTDPESGPGATFHPRTEFRRPGEMPAPGSEPASKSTRRLRAGRGAGGTVPRQLRPRHHVPGPVSDPAVTWAYAPGIVGPEPRRHRGRPRRAAGRVLRL